jgi:Holliday junction DNA helicase RuvB
MGTNLVTTSGPAIERGADLMGILTNLGANDVMFIDEIHRLPRAVEELLYPAMEDFSVNFVIDKGMHARTLKYALRPFKLVASHHAPRHAVGAAARAVGISSTSTSTRTDELTRIVRARPLSPLGEARIDESGAREISRRSRGTPRIANRLLRRVRDYAQVKADGVISEAGRAGSLRREGVGRPRARQARPPVPRGHHRSPTTAGRWVWRRGRATINTSRNEARRSWNHTC